MSTISQLAGVGLFDARVPRYTSYPTAPHFSDQIGPDQFQDWIEAVPEDGQISLYIHIPFCRRLCWFCACRTQGTQSIDPVRIYLETLKSEIALLKARLPSGVTLARLHWGGGTPTLLAPDMIADLTDKIFAMSPLDETGEFSVEIDPNEIDEARLAALAAAGMNRVSIGVQDFDPEIQAVIGRAQTYEETRDAIEAVRAVGVHSLNADILYGLPHQTNARITESVTKLLSLAPDRVALYGYAHVPWLAKRQSMIPTDVLPTPQERLSLFETAQALFRADGYADIGIDHFALPGDGLQRAQAAGRLRRNFQGYTEDSSEVLIGLGASAISRFPQGYAQNASATSKYTAAVRRRQFATARGHAFTDEDRLYGRIIEALMCDFRVSADELVQGYGATPALLKSIFQQTAAQFGDFVSFSESGFEIRPKGRPLTRIIARAFDAYDLSSTGHSSAV